MRVGIILAAIAALWVQPAQATAIWTFAISAHVTGTDLPYTPGQPPQFIPIEWDVGLLVDLPAFTDASSLSSRLGCVLCDPLGLGGRAPVITGLISSAPNGAFLGSNFSYIGGPAEFSPPKFGAAYYTLAAPTFAVSFLRASGGPGPVPEPATWALMLVGFAAIGLTMRAKHGRRPDPAKA
jgi:hypothetical protein